MTRNHLAIVCTLFSLAACSAPDEASPGGTDSHPEQSSSTGGTTGGSGPVTPGSGGMLGASGGTGATMEVGSGGLQVDPGDPPPVDINPACGVELARITLSQGPQIDLMNAGVVPSTLAPPIAGRQGLFRIFVESTAAPHAVTAHLGLTTGGTTTWLSATRTPSLSPTDADLESTFNVEVAGELLGEDTTYEVLLSEDAACASPGVRTRFPETGAQNLAAEKTGAVRVRVFPITIGNGRTPHAPASLIDRFASDGHALYPSEGFDVSLGPALSWTDIKIPEVINSQAAADQLAAQWTALVDRLCAYRAQNGAAGDEHYYGLVQTNSSLAQSMVVGLAENPSRDVPGLVQASCAVGVSHAGSEDFTSETFVHELAHAHSLSHSPGCDAGEPDPAYPYASDGGIGSWGWDHRDGSLRAPGAHHDFLSYCVPYWVSDYTFGKLSGALGTIAASAITHRRAAPRLFQSVVIQQGGQLTLGSLYEEDGLAVGTQLVHVIRKDGESAVVQAVVRTMDDLGATLLRVPVAEDWQLIHVGDQSVTRSGGMSVPD